MKTWLRNLLKVLSMGLCTIPPALATIYYFPIWYRESEFQMVMPATAIFCFCLCSIPLLKWLARKIKTPSAWMVWLLVAVVLYMIQAIIAQLIIISSIGAIGNIIGALLWKIASKGETVQ